MESGFPVLCLWLGSLRCCVLGRLGWLWLRLLRGRLA
jgi:hypothetical protein